ncbi:hypothetical protein GXB85_04050 [Cellulomonas sp. APG4]|uniref:hypothetical protein n=1 Tax=Cellulomonas sp. APG4 TaxID=1538656 RepID=UPI00137A033A|nr:hypothetical protein [Cellulomonas sp. APG4]NCT90127.1 hypothetical protein [Cellulomonas sp. APG4]
MLTDKNHKPEWAPVPNDRLEGTLARLNKEMAEAEDTLLAAAERGQKLDALNQRASAADEATLRQRYPALDGRVGEL